MIKRYKSGEWISPVLKMNEQQKSEWKNKISNALMGKKASLESIINRQKTMLLNRPKKEEIIENFKNIWKYEGKKTLMELRKHKKVICSVGLIEKIFNNKLHNIIFNYIGLELDIKSKVWRRKENFVENVIKQKYDNNLIIKPKTEHGIPDIITNDCIYEIKSYLYKGWFKQLKKYELLGKPVKFIVFEEKGKTDIDNEKIVFLKSLIINDEILLEKYNRIKDNIPENQLSLLNKNLLKQYA